MMNIKALVMGAMVMVGSATATVPTTAQIQVPTVSTVQTQEVVKEEVVKVYVTKTGSKFHKASCKTLLKSKIEIELKKAMLTYEPCKQCHSDLEYNDLMKQAKQLKEEQKVANKVQPTQPTEQERTLTIASKPR